MDRNLLIGQRIVEARELRNMKAKDLAESIGVTSTRLSNWENGTSGVNADFIFKISEKLNVTSDYLIGITDNPGEISDKPISKQMLHTISNMYRLNEEGQNRVSNYSDDLLESGKYKNENPKVINIADYIKDRSETYAESYAESYDELISNARATAGHGAFNYEDHEQFHSVKTDLLPEYDYDEVVEVRGSSMEPTIKDGDVSFVKYNQDFIDGKIYVVNIAGEIVIKICYFEKDKLTLVSENKDWEDRIIEGADLNQVKIVGRVIGWATPEK